MTENALETTHKCGETSGETRIKQVLAIASKCRHYIQRETIEI